MTEFVPFYVILSQIIKFGINGEVLFGIENMVSDVWIDFLVMEAMCAVVCMGEFWGEKGMWMV